MIKDERCYEKNTIQKTFGRLAAEKMMSLVEGYCGHSLEKCSNSLKALSHMGSVDFSTQHPAYRIRDF
ncbi:MAG: hypothetical protein ACI8VC_001821 [Candidatus Endobugula sp.]|jgi:hypothetical protein